MTLGWSPGPYALPVHCCGSWHLGGEARVRGSPNPTIIGPSAMLCPISPTLGQGAGMLLGAGMLRSGLAASWLFPPARGSLCRDASRFSSLGCQSFVMVLQACWEQLGVGPYSKACL